MLIENKINGKRFNVSEKEWEEMNKNIIPGSENQNGKGKPFATRYKVINTHSEAEKNNLVPPELRRSTATAEDIQHDAEKKRIASSGK